MSLDLYQLFPANKTSNFTAVGSKRRVRSLLGNDFNGGAVRISPSPSPSVTSQTVIWTGARAAAFMANLVVVRDGTDD